MLAQVPALIERIQPVMDGSNVEQKNALTLLQLGLEHFHPYIAGLLWVTGLEAIFDSGWTRRVQEELCDCLGSQAMVFPNWHSSLMRPPTRWRSFPSLSICSETSSRMVQTFALGQPTRNIPLISGR